MKNCGNCEFFKDSEPTQQICFFCFDFSGRPPYYPDYSKWSAADPANQCPSCGEDMSEAKSWWISPLGSFFETDFPIILKIYELSERVGFDMLPGVREYEHAFVTICPHCEAGLT